MKLIKRYKLKWRRRQIEKSYHATYTQLGARLLDAYNNSGLGIKILLQLVEIENAVRDVSMATRTGQLTVFLLHPAPLLRQLATLKRDMLQIDNTLNEMDAI